MRLFTTPKMAIIRLLNFLSTWNMLLIPEEEQ